MQNIDIKRGDTLEFAIQLLDENDDPINLEVDKIKSEIRTSGNTLIGEFDITRLETGDYNFLVADTTKFPIGTLYFDIKLDILGKIKHSEDTSITVKEERTRGQN